MHEMSFVLMTLKELENITKNNNVKELISVTLNIGESSTVEEDYFRTCWNAVTKDTDWKDTKLKINMIPSNGKCLRCGNVFEISKNNYICPKCHERSYIPLTGKDIEISEIEAK